MKRNCHVPLDVGSLLLFRTGPNEEFGGAEEDRTPDLLRARQALSQLSYGPGVIRLWRIASQFAQQTAS